MEILNLFLEEQLFIKYCVAKHLILLKRRDMMDISTDLLRRFVNVLIKTFGGAATITNKSAIKNENIFNK